MVRWNGLIKFRSPAERKRMVREVFLEVLKELDVNESDFFNIRTQPARIARHRMAVIARELLCDFMSDVEIAEFIGIPRSTYITGMKLWVEENGE